MLLVEYARGESLSMQIAKSVENRVENFARFLFIERRPAQRGGKRVVGKFKDGIKDCFPGVIGAAEIKKLD